MDSRNIPPTKYSMKERIEIYKLAKKPRKQVRLKFDVIQKESLPFLNQNHQSITNTFKGLHTFTKTRTTKKHTKQFISLSRIRP
jgi:hypothetical protein